ncbi:MAG TPA: EAL domain-containing protein, partial [Mycobacteriales bacterium]|nr:EAL domain-containing protein [Mycobacteriales bacterium]
MISLFLQRDETSTDDMNHHQTSGDQVMDVLAPQLAGTGWSRRRRRDTAGTSLGSAVAALTVIIGIAVATRIAASDATLATVAVCALAVLALVGGGRQVAAQRSARWRGGWALLGLGLVLFAVSSVLRLGVTGGGLEQRARLVTAAANVVAAAGLALLIRHRGRGRGMDASLEALVVGGTVGYLAWTFAALPSESTVDPWRFVVLASTAACIWLTTRLLGTGPDRPRVLQFLLAGWVAKFAVSAFAFSNVLLGWQVTDGRIAGLTLWAFGLWAAGAIHPSLRKPLDAAQIRDLRDVPARAALLGSSVLVVPAVVGLQLLAGTTPRLTVVIVGGTILPFAVVLHMSHQLFERARAEHRAQHDALTGLPNRNLFHDRLNTAVAQAQRLDASFAVMFLDLDRFKTVNDSLGHAAGNQLLQAVARRVRSCLREQDVLARVGGDEFTLLVHDVDEDSAATVAQKVLDSFTEAFTVGGRTVFTSTSVGIATFPDNGPDAEALLKHADTAMYRAKARGRNVFQFYTADMSMRASVKLSLESSLHTAIERRQLTLHFQPQVSMHDGRLVGLEALARWRHPRLGYISPYAFIPLAEESGLIQPLGEWAVESACRQLKEWSEQGLPVVPVAVNVSAQQLSHRPVDDLIERTLAAAGLPGGLLEVELTETVLVDDVHQVSAFLERLQELGVRTSIDDFGTGYSGLSYLAQMPINTLKIDRSFVQQIGAPTGDQGIIGAIIALAAQLGLEVVAEGVETYAQARVLAAHGCGRMQGYLVSPPVPADAVPALLQRGTLFSWPADDDQASEIYAHDSGSPPSPFFGDPRIAALLQAICGTDASATLDAETLGAVLAALQPTMSAANVLARPMSARLATGTFAGLLPLSGGLAAAGALPAPVQHAYANLLAGIGFQVPAPRSGDVGPQEVVLADDGIVAGRSVGGAGWTHLSYVGQPGPTGAGLRQGADQTGPRPADSHPGGGTGSAGADAPAGAPVVPAPSAPEALAPAPDPVTDTSGRSPGGVGAESGPADPGPGSTGAVGSTGSGGGSGLTGSGWGGAGSTGAGSTGAGSTGSAGSGSDGTHGSGSAGPGGGHG